MEKKFKTLKEFYPYYLTEHSNTVCRSLHFAGTSLVFVLFFTALFTANWYLCWFIPLAGYGFAWVGHFFYEKNKPASFKQPLFSLVSDFLMYFDLLLGKIPFKTSSN